jgi:hypothetical protein
MVTFTAQKQSNDQGLKKAIESERNGSERTITITITTSPSPWKMEPFAFICNKCKYVRDPTIIFIHLTNLIV